MLLAASITMYCYWQSEVNKDSLLFPECCEAKKRYSFRFHKHYKDWFGARVWTRPYKHADEQDRVHCCLPTESLWIITTCTILSCPETKELQLFSRSALRNQLARCGVYSELGPWAAIYKMNWTIFCRTKSVTWALAPTSAVGADRRRVKGR